MNIVRRPRLLLLNPIQMSTGCAYGLTKPNVQTAIIVNVTSRNYVLEEEIESSTDLLSNRPTV